MNAATWVANILPADNPYPPPEYGCVAYQIKGNVACSNMVANGQKVKISTCSEYGHVAYQIKGNGTCSYMVANILPADPETRGWVNRSKFQLFSSPEPKAQW